MRVQSRERLQGMLETYKSRNAMHSTLQVRRRVRAPVKSMESVNDATGLYIPTTSGKRDLCVSLSPSTSSKNILSGMEK